MPIVLPQQQTAREYVMAKIDRVYADRKEIYDKKKLQVAIRHRRQLKNARVTFQRDLDHALNSVTQTGLGIKIVIDQEALPIPRFVARFKFLGQQWQIRQEKTFLGSQWVFSVKGQGFATRCVTKDLEAQLCYALGQHKTSISHLARLVC